MSGGKHLLSNKRLPNRSEISARHTNAQQQAYSKIERNTTALPPKHTILPPFGRARVGAWSLEWGVYIKKRISSLSGRYIIIGYILITKNNYDLCTKDSDWQMSNPWKFTSSQIANPLKHIYNIYLRCKNTGNAAIGMSIIVHNMKKYVHGNIFACPWTYFYKATHYFLCLPALFLG